MKKVLADSDGLRAIDWAFLALGRTWERLHRGVWHIYAGAAIARSNGERAYEAEVRLFKLMTDDERQHALVGTAKTLSHLTVYEVDALAKDPPTVDHLEEVAKRSLLEAAEYVELERLKRLRHAVAIEWRRRRPSGWLGGMVPPPVEL